ncbi:unnamed protein product [Cunninghamella blakesleeana]
MSDNERSGTVDDNLSLPKALGFEDYVEEVDEVFKEHKRQQKVKDRDKKSSRLENTGISEEELLRQQELLFAQSRQRYEAQQQ